MYKEKYLAVFAKPKKHLKAGQPEMFRGDQLDLLSFAHKEGPSRDHWSLYWCCQPLLETASLGMKDKAWGRVLPTGAKGQEDAPHVHELVVVAVPPVLPAFPLAGAVHPKRECVSTLKPREAVTLHCVPAIVMSELRAHPPWGLLLSIPHWGLPTSDPVLLHPGSTDLGGQPVTLTENSTYEGIF